MLLKKKLADPNVFNKTSKDYEKPVEDFLKTGKEAYFSKVKTKYPGQEELDRTNEFLKSLKIKNVVK